MAKERPVLGALGMGLFFTWKMSVGIEESPGWKQEGTEVLKKTLRFRVKNKPIVDWRHMNSSRSDWIN